MAKSLSADKDAHLNWYCQLIISLNWISWKFKTVMAVRSVEWHRCNQAHACPLRMIHLNCEFYQRGFLIFMAPHLHAQQISRHFPSFHVFFTEYVLSDCNGTLLWRIITVNCISRHKDAIRSQDFGTKRIAVRKTWELHQFCTCNLCVNQVHQFCTCNPCVNEVHQVRQQRKFQ